MTSRTLPTLVVLLFATCTVAHAQAPSGATGQCKDGTYSTAASKDGACRGHKGVQAWYAAPSSAASSKPASSPKPTASATVAAKSPAPEAAQSGPAPVGATGQCKDGSYSSAASKDGACRGHQGVKTWFSAPAVPSTSASNPVKPVSTPAPAAIPHPAPAPAAAQQSAHTQNTAAPAPGGGNGQVWVNLESKVYHCSGDRYYGKTKKGTYMSESDAVAKGARPDAGKPCPK